MPRQGEQNDMEFAKRLIELGRELEDLPEDLQKAYMGRGDEGSEEGPEELIEPTIQILAIEPTVSEPATLGVASMGLMSAPPAPIDPATEAAQSKINFARSLKNGAKTLETLMNKAAGAANARFASAQIKNAITKIGGLIQDSKNQAFYDDSESLKSTVASLEAMMNDLNEFLQSGGSSDVNVIQGWKDKAASILEEMRATSQSLSEEAKNEMQAAEDAFNKAKELIEKSKKLAEKADAKEKEAEKLDNRSDKIADRADRKEDRAEKLDKRAEKLANRADNPNKTEDEAKKLAEKAEKLAARADKKEDKAKKLDKRAEKLADRSDKKDDKAKKLDDKAEKLADEAAKLIADANSNDSSDIPASNSDVTPDVDTDPSDALTHTVDDATPLTDTLAV